MLVRGVVDDEVDDNTHATLVGAGEERIEVVHRPVQRVDRGVIGDVVTAITQRRGKERGQPDRVDAQPLEVVELLDHPLEVSVAVTVGVTEATNHYFIENSLAIPLGVDGELFSHAL
ncbi:MAG: hypothetical protein RJA31_414 [Actinomycetota bacterium]